MAHRPIGMILTAGFGTRLRPLTLLRPKPIMEIAGKPIIYFLIRMLENAGVRDIFLNLHHQADQIRRYIERNKFDARIHLVHEREILGTAGGIAHVIRKFGVRDREMVVLHGDIIVDLDLKPYLGTGKFCTLLCAKDHLVPGYVGSVGINRRGAIVELGRFYKSESTAHERGFFTGIHVLSPEAVAEVARSTEASLVADVYPRFLRNGRVISGVVRSLHYDDLGSAERIFHANMAIVKGAHFDHMKPFEDLSPMPGHNGVVTGACADIAPSAALVPPLMLGPNVTIHDEARVGPHVVLGAHATVGARARVANSVIFSDTDVEKDEVLDCALALRSARVLVKGS